MATPFHCQALDFAEAPTQHTQTASLILLCARHAVKVKTVNAFPATKCVETPPAGRPYMTNRGPASQVRGSCRGKAKVACSLIDGQRYGSRMRQAAAGSGNGQRGRAPGSPLRSTYGEGRRARARH